MLNSAARWLSEQCQEHLSVPVEYLPKSGEPLTVRAVVGRTLFRGENQYGATIRTEARDFLVSVKDLPGEPERGDRVRWNGRLFEVLSPNSEPHWRWSDGHMNTRRIHTKEIGEDYEQ